MEFSITESGRGTGVTAFARLSAKYSPSGELMEITEFATYPAGSDTGIGGDPLGLMPVSSKVLIPRYSLTQEEFENKCKLNQQIFNELYKIAQNGQEVESSIQIQQWKKEAERGFLNQSDW